MNCWVEPAAKLGFAGVTAIEESVLVDAVTVSVVVPVTPLREAEMAVDPAATAVARPAALMVATVVAELDHVAVSVTFCIDPSL